MADSPDMLADMRALVAALGGAGLQPEHLPAIYRLIRDLPAVYARTIPTCAWCVKSDEMSRLGSSDEWHCCYCGHFSMVVDGVTVKGQP